MELVKKLEKRFVPDGYLPPQAVEIEQAVLSALLIDSMAIDQVLVILKSEKVFYKLQHQLIYKAVMDLVAAGDPVDLLTVSNQLRINGKLDIVGGDFVLIQISQVLASAANVEYHARVVLQQWVKRVSIGNSEKLINMAYDDTTDIFDLIERNEKQLDEIGDAINTGADTLSFPDALDLVVQRVERISSLEANAVSGVSTGFASMDRHTGGWQNSDLVVIAARPGMGKTALVLKNVLEVARSGAAVGMFSLEMSTQQLATRLISINTDLHLAQLFRDGFKDEKSEQYFITLLTASTEMKKLPIYIDDSPGLTIAELHLKARQWKRQHDIKILFVDYIQLMAGDDSTGGNREANISNISRKLKHLAKELDIPVIALSQLSRAVESRQDKRPKLSDLRESGAIEQDADIVAFIYRPEYYEAPLSEQCLEYGANTEIGFGKFRNGSTSTVYLWFNKNKTKFIDPTEKTDTDVNDDLPF